MAYEIPVGSDQAQRFVTELGGASYEFFLQFNERSSVWELSLKAYGASDWLILGAPMLLDVDLLSPYSYNIGRLIAIDTSDSDVEAGVSDLGSRVKLFWIAPGEEQ